MNNNKIKLAVQIYKEFIDYDFKQYKRDSYDNDLDFHNQDTDKMTDFVIRCLDSETDDELIKIFKQFISDITGFEDDSEDEDNILEYNDCLYFLDKLKNKINNFNENQNKKSK